MMIFLVIIILVVIVLWVILTHLYEKSLVEDVDISRLREKLTPVFPELKKLKLMKGNSSYIINKYRVFICLRDKKTNVLYDDNMLVYVILHELAHAKCHEIGHTKLFKQIFFNLLDRAETYGLYDPSLPRPNDYCK